MKMLGSNKKCRVNETGLCLKGNPVAVKDYREKLNDFKYNYLVKIKRTAFGKMFRVVAKHN